MGTTDLYFTNESSSSSTSSSNYTQDVFLDVSLPATSNSGLTSNASTNPLGNFFGNDDVPRYSAKTLWIKDYVLITDRSLWIGGKPTYRILFHENFTPVHGYCFGDIDFNSGRVKRISDGFGISGVVRKVQWILRPNSQNSATAQLALDGANTSTINFSSDQVSSNGLAYFVAEAANETSDLHDYRLTAIQNDTLQVVGVVVYSENAGANLNCFPGTTYNNKSKQISTSGSTLSLPAYGSSLGGRALIYHSGTNGYALTTQGASMVQSIAVGSSGTNLVNVSTGQGSLYKVGDGIVINSSLPTYLGSVLSISTDTLTVSPTLAFGISQMIYRTWSAGPTYAIGASLYTLSESLDDQSFGNISGSTDTFYSIPSMGNFNLWGQNVGRKTLDNVPGFFFKGASFGMIQLDGFYSAAEIEYYGAGILHATFSVNGQPAFGVNEGLTGPIKKTVFTNAGPGWNSFVMTVGTSMSPSLMISQINLYRNAYNPSPTFGFLAHFGTLQTPVFSSVVNATLPVLGSYRRVYSDSLFYNSAGVSAQMWTRQTGVSLTGGVQYVGSTTGTQWTHEYFGKNYAVIGTIGTSYNFTFDGASTTLTLGALQSVSTEGFHKMVFTHKSGTCVIQAIDYTRTTSELTNLQNSAALSVTTQIQSIDFDVNGRYTSLNPQTGVCYEILKRDFRVLGHRLYIKGAGSTGITSVDVQHQSRSQGFTSLFQTLPIANANLGSNVFGEQGLFQKVPFILEKDSVLRFDIPSSQLGANGFLFKLYGEEL